MSRPLSVLCASLVACCALACGDDIRTVTIITEPDALQCSCDDFDGCTDDFCQADGTCLHVGRNAFDACQTDAHCDDGNPCSDDRCELDACGLMRCNRALPPIDDCVPCGDFFGPCSDGNPCTPEQCGDNDICVFHDADPNCDAMCNQLAWSADQAQWGGFEGYTSHFIGTVRSAQGVNCDGDACTCRSDVMFADYGTPFDLRDASGVNDPEWVCDIEACELRTVSCSPVMEGVGYVMWGMMTYRSAQPASAPTPRADTAAFADAGASDAGAPPQWPIDAFLVQGYCLSTRLTHLVGAYAATFESDGQLASFDLRVTEDESLLVAAMTGCVGCDVTGLVADQQFKLGPEPETVTFTLVLSDGPGFARLYARADHFVGDVRRSDGGFLGKLTLERLPPR